MNPCPDPWPPPSRRRSAKTRGACLRAAALCALAASECEGTPDATFQLDVPSALASEASWYEIGVFPGGCPAASLLLGGIPTQGTFGRLAFAASNQNPPGLGDLPSQSYGIAAVARAADCSVIGTGCSSQSISGSGSLTVSIAAVAGPPAGACEAGSVCDDAECVPSLDADAGTGEEAGENASVGEACTLSLIGQGPLADQLGADSTLLSAPAIAATPSGFLIAYREFDPTAGAARLTTIAVAPDGAADPPTQTPLLDVCTGSPETDATGLVFSGSTGTIALSRPACMEGDAGGSTEGGLVLVTLDPTGAITGSSFTDAAGSDVVLSQAHALADSPKGVLLAYTDATSKASSAVTITGTSVATSPAPVPFSTFGVRSDSSAYVVGTSYGAGYLAVATGGAEDTAILATQAESASVGGAWSLPAQWASASGSGSRILVVTSSAAGESSILWTAFDIGTKDALHSGTFGPASMGSVSFADVAMSGDHAYVAAEVGQSISLFAFEKASTLPVELGEFPFASRPAIPVGQLTGGLVAVAAEGSLVAVVWGTGPTLGPDDAVGGYAVFTCAP